MDGTACLKLIRSRAKSWRLAGEELRMREDIGYEPGAQRIELATLDVILSIDTDTALTTVI